MTKTTRITGDNNKAAISVGVCAERALQLMTEQNISPTPQNYQLWYSYASGEVPLLNRMIDDCLQKTKQIGNDLSLRLYMRFFGPSGEEQAVREAGQQMQTELENIISRLRSAESDTTRFGDVLMGFNNDIADVNDTGGLRNLITDLAQETQDMHSKARGLESELKKSSDEIDRLRKKLDVARAEALTDELTGIGNRKQFNCILKMTTEEALGSRKPLSMIFGDVDHFKNFNDTWGHKLGDHVLRLVAHQMKALVGNGGTPTRYGGEEFAIVLPQASMAEAVAIAENIRLSVSKKQMKTKTTGVTLGRITMSFGVAQYNPGESPEEFVERADSALYAAKEGGRNRVVAAESTKVSATA